MDSRVPDPGARRVDYQAPPLDRAGLPDEPLPLFEAWYAAAVAADLREPEGMALATVDAHGRPSCRIVLMRSIDARGIVFYTNYESRKALDLAADPRAAATFWWARLERQVRVEGAVERVPDAESDAYFATRPRLNQLSAWASPQSTAVDDRALLERRIAEFARRWPEGAVIPRPPHWGGYVLIPDAIEFWQGRPGRVHDRFRYARATSGWRIERLAP